jgi:hypothetical protein
MSEQFNIKDVPFGWSGVYQIVLDHEIVYVGQAQDMRKRLAAYALPTARRIGLFKGIPFKKLQVIFHPVEGLEARLAKEAERIKLFRPRCNISQMGIGRVIHYRNQSTMNQQFRKFVNDFGGQSKVAILLDMSPGHVSLLFNGHRKVTPKMASRIEIASGGKYSKESLVFGTRS